MNTSKKKSIADLQKVILDLERKYDLLNTPVAGIKIWQAIRVPLYYGFTKKLSIFDEQQTIKKSFRDLFGALPSYIKSSVLYNPLLSKKKRSVIVFDHSRKVLYQGRYIDIYTQYLLDEFEREHVDYEVIEEQHHNRHLTARSPLRRHMDFIQICANLYPVFFRARFTEDEKDFIKTIDNELKERLDIQSDLLPLFSREISKFKAYHYFYKKILMLKRPERIYLLVGYGHTALIRAARDLNIESVEIQHGTISEYHLGYHYPDSPKGSLDYFPDKINLWDHYWKEMCSFPLDDDRLVVTGFKHLEKEAAKYCNVRKKKKQVIVISQGAIGEKLSELIHDNIGDLGDYSIIYKLHPGEYDRWQGYSGLRKLANHPNVTIVASGNPPLYQLLAESEYLIGVYSTVIFESLSFGCRILLADLPGVEYMHRLINNRLVTGHVSLIANPHRIIDQLVPGK